MRRIAHVVLLAALVAAATAGGRPLAQVPAAPAGPSSSPATPAATERPAEAAAAPEPLVEAPPPRGVVGLGAQLGMFSGTGVGVQLGTPAAGLRVAAGWAPLLLAVTERTTTRTGTGDTVRLKFYSGLVVAPDLYLRVTQARLTAIGVQAGYRYSTLLGSGGAAGLYIAHPLSRSVDLVAGGGVLFFPDGEARLKDKKHLASTTDFGFPGPAVNVALSAGLVFFP